MNEQKKDNLLTIEDLVVEYDTDEAVVQAVNHVSLQLGRGETLGLVGETGAGNTAYSAGSARQGMQWPDPVRWGRPSCIE